MADELTEVRRVLRRACDGAAALDRLEISYVQAGPDGPVRVLYEAPAIGGTRLRVTARRVDIVKGPQLAASINARCGPPDPSSGFTQSAMYAPDLELLFQVFPADDRLGSLAIAVSGHAMRRILETTLRVNACTSDRKSPADGRLPTARRLPTPLTLQSVAANVMRYKPERKCLLRYDLVWAGHDVDVDAPAVVWARVARRAKFERTHRNLARVRAEAAGIGFDMPEPLGDVPELAMELFGAVRGPVLFALTRSDEFPALCRATGDALRRFHALPVELPERFDVAAQLDRLHENAVEFAWMLPRDESRIAAAEQAIAARLQALPTAPGRLIHRDFHGDNVLVDDGRLILMDFEDCALGEPADDVASNWAQLTWHVHKAGARAALTASARQAFLDGYLADADSHTERCLPVYSALHCFLYAHQCLRHPQDPARYDDAHAMLAACEAVLEHGLHAV